MHLRGLRSVWALLGWAPIAFSLLACQHHAKTQADLDEPGREPPPADTGDGAPKGSPPPDVVRTGVPTVTYPSFEVTPDGRSIVRLTTTAPNSQVNEQKAEGRLVYLIPGVTVPYKVNRLPLVTTGFATQVTEVEVTSVPGGASVVVSLREPSTATVATGKVEGGTQITITLPKSEKWSKQGKYGSMTGAPSSDDDGSETGQHRRHRKSADQHDVENADKTQETDDTRYKRKIRQPIPWTERHITLPYMTLAPDIGFSAFGVGKTDTNIWLASGIKWGITDHVEVEITPNSFRFTPDAAYAEPSLAATFLFFAKTVEMAGRARFFLPIDTALSGQSILNLSLPVWFHLGHVARLETGANVSLHFGSPTHIALAELPMASPVLEDPGIPVKVIFQPLSQLFVGVHTGFGIGDFSAAKETTYLPLGAQIGITATSEEQPSADFGLRFDWQHFLTPNLDDKVQEDTYQIGAWLKWYYYL